MVKRGLGMTHVAIIVILGNDELAMVKIVTIARSTTDDAVRNVCMCMA